MLRRRRNGINNLTMAVFLFAACAGTTQAASTAADPASVARASTQLVVRIERPDCNGYRLHAAAGGRARLLSSHRAACNASLAPDGRHVAYLAFDGEVPTLYVEKPDGSSRLAIAACTSAECDWGRLTPNPFLSYAWSPAGDRLVYTTRQGGRSYIRVADLRGEVLADLTPPRTRPTTVFMDPAWSPRGGWITVVNAYSDEFTFPLATEIDIVRADGRGWRRLVRTVYERQHMFWPTIAWAPEGSRLAIENASHSPAMIYAVFTPGGRRLVSTDCARGPSYCPVGLSWSPRGRRIAWVRGRELTVAAPNLLGIRRSKIRATGEFTDPEWSRDGRLMSLVRTAPNSAFAKEVVVTSTRGGKPKRVLTAPRGWEVVSHAWQTVAR
jgi:hypothetical protein